MRLRLVWVPVPLTKSVRKTVAVIGFATPKVTRLLISVCSFILMKITVSVEQTLLSG